MLQQTSKFGFLNNISQMIEEGREIALLKQKYNGQCTEQVDETPKGKDVGET